MKKRVIFSVIAAIMTAALLISCLALFAACNKKRSFTDIFKSEDYVSELTSYKEELRIPNGWQLYINTSTGSNASDAGYIPEINAFVVQHTATSVLSVIKCGDNSTHFEGGTPGMLFPLSAGISQLRIKNGFIACKFKEGYAGVFDVNGNTVLSRTRINKASSSSAAIDTVVSILNGGMFAVYYSYDTNGESGYTSIYRPTYSGPATERGELVCRVKNDGNVISYLNGFDDKYVTVVGNSSGSYIYRIPDHANGSVQNLTATSRGSVEKNGEDDYFSEITYIGNGRFFIHEDWTVEKDEDYMYYDGYDYYCFSRHIYTPDNDKRTEYTDNEDKVFLYLSNNYYDSSKNGIDTSSYLNDGYTYANYALTIINKVGYYDQFILDKDLKVVMSLTGNYGVHIKDQKKEKVGHFDLIMSCVNGYYYCPVLPSTVAIYNSKGEKVGGNDRTAVSYQELSNNIIIAAVPDPDDKDTIVYIAYNIYGEEITKHYYTKLAAYRGAYTVGERKNSDGVNTLYLVDINGNEVELDSEFAVPFSDMATTKTGTGIYKIGSYMYKEVSGTDSQGKTTYKYGVRNLNPNRDESIIIDAHMEEGSMLYAPTSSPKDVFVLEKVTASDGSASYIVYRLY